MQRRGTPEPAFEDEHREAEPRGGLSFNSAAPEPSSAAHNRDESGSYASPGVFVFNPFAEACVACGLSFTPVLHQAKLAEDLASLPQFLGQPGDVVLLTNPPSSAFLDTLRQAGFAPPEFVKLIRGRIDPAGRLGERTLGSLRPWAWSPDSVRLLQPLFKRVRGGWRPADQCFNAALGRLYSKSWSARFLSKVLARCREGPGGHRPGGSALDATAFSRGAHWLCTEQEVGRTVATLEDALAVIAEIRRSGHHRVVVKKAYGLAGQNALRLWEPDLLATQRQWLLHALDGGQEVVVEPWLDRVVDFSIQLEMGHSGLRLCGFTGLATDCRGQFEANWAEAGYRRQVPVRVGACLRAAGASPRDQERLWTEIFSLLEMELKGVGFLGPVGLDALVYRTTRDEYRLKPVVEMNPRYTMGRVTVELMRHVCAETSGLLRLVTCAQARAKGYADLQSYACAFRASQPVRRESTSEARIRQGGICLTDPEQARACLATFEVGSDGSPRELGGSMTRRETR